MACVLKNGGLCVICTGELADAGMVSFVDNLGDGDAEAIRTYIINQANLTLQ